jgi:hypothetical protein
MKQAPTQEDRRRLACSPPACRILRTILDRLLALNYQRYEKEVKTGLHNKKGKTIRTGGKRGRKLKSPSSKLDPITREETKTLEMLYRRHLQFAVGHGVSVHVTLPEPLAEKAWAIETEFVPQAEVAEQTPPTSTDLGFESLTALTLDMRELAELPKAGLVTNLRILENAYRNWIAKEACKPSDPTEKLAEHQAAAQRVVGRCQRALSRIKEGINLIDSNAQAGDRSPHRRALAGPLLGANADDHPGGAPPAVSSDAALPLATPHSCAAGLPSGYRHAVVC